MPLIIRETGFEDYLDPSGDAYIKTLIIGAHGVGKTPSAVAWPKPIIADCERGLMSVASKKVPYATITSTEDMDAFLELVRRDSLLPNDKRKYQTIVLDTVDSYQRTIIQSRLRKERRDALSGWADWGWLDGKMQQLIERLVNIKANVVVNMHYKDEHTKDGEDSILVKKARLKGDIKDSIFQDFDLIGFMETYYEAEKGERVLKRHIRWHPDPAYAMVRDRSNKLPRFTEVTFEHADYQQIFDAITEGIDDLPQSRIVEELAVEGDDGAEVPEAGTGSGPVQEPKLPPTKRAPAKKAAAKKAPAKAPEQPAPPSTDDLPPETAKAIEEADDQVKVQDALQDLRDKLDAEVISQEKTHPGTGVVSEGVEVPADGKPHELTSEAPKPEPAVEVSKASPPVRTAKVCGDQPDVFKGKVDATPGCGRELNAQNTDRSKASMLTFKTYLCNDCWSTHTA